MTGYVKFEKINKQTYNACTRILRIYVVLVDFSISWKEFVEKEIIDASYLLGPIWEMQIRTTYRLYQFLF